MNDSIITNQWLENMNEVLGGSFKDWLWDGNAPVDLGYATGDCICGKEGIRYEYTIVHHLNGNVRIVGSSCYKKFIHRTLGLSYDEIQNDMNILEATARKNYREKVFIESLDIAKEIDTYVKTAYYKMKNYFESTNGEITVNYLVTLAIALKKHPNLEKLKVMKLNFRQQEERIALAKLKEYTYKMIEPVLIANGQGDYYEKYREEYSFLLK